MKKKITLFVCAMFLLTLTMGLLVGCGDDEPKGEIDPIVGTWIGTETSENYTRYFHADIIKSTQYDNCFVVEIKLVYSKKDMESVTLTKGNIYKNPKIENRYSYDGDLSPLPHKQDGENWRFHYTFDISGDRINIAGNEERRNSLGNFTPFSATYTFERTTLTLAQYEDQIKSA